MANRRLPPGGFRACLDYWKLAFRNEYCLAKGIVHNPAEPVYVMGMKIYTFTLGRLVYLLEEIFLEWDYVFTPAGNPPVIIDCGSNIGISILFFKKLFPAARIIGFEPDKKTFELLSRNVAENNLSDVRLHNAAVSSYNGEVTFFDNPEDPGSLMMSVHSERMSGRSRQVPCVRLSEFLTEPVDMLKMDIEGAETLVMPELVASGVLQNVKLLTMEYHHHLGPDDQLSKMLQLLEENSFGYDVGAKVPDPPRTFQDILLRTYRKERPHNREPVDARHEDALARR